MEWQVSLNNDSFERAGITKDCKDAVCEYIWNGFEAGATKVSVTLHGEELQEAMSLVVSDNGSGIPFQEFGDTFAKFLSSLKNNATIRLKSQLNKGKGRFSYMCFSSSAEWTTTFKEDGTYKQYKINTNSINRSAFGTTDPIILKENLHTGTSVEFPLMEATVVNQLAYVNMRQKLLEEFAWFLYLNKDKGVSLEYMGVILDVSQYINTELSGQSRVNIGDISFDINVVVWTNNVANSSKIYYLTERGEIANVENTSFNKNKVNFYHAVFVSSKYITLDTFFPQDDEIEPSEQMEMEPQQHNKAIFRQLKKVISALVADVLKKFLVKQADTKLAEMAQRGSMPKFSNDKYGELRKKDFEVVTKELFCVEPYIFHKLNPTQEKSLLGFLNLLLNSEERENILEIVEQVVSLTPEQRSSFASILQRTKLQYIVDVIETIEKRITIVEELKKIVFSYTSFANERIHIQKIIEQHFWLFGEQYHLLTADKNLKTSLEEFEKITEITDIHAPVGLSDKELAQRIDVFLYSQRVQEDSSSEMLIIELKAPYIKLSLDVYNQVVRYANTLRKEPRFIGANRKWRFFAVCSVVEDEVKVKYENFIQHGKKGLVDIIGNFEIYALSWDDIFQSFEARHSFLLDKLKFDYSQVVATLDGQDDKPVSRETVTQLSEKLVALSV